MAFGMSAPNTTCEESTNIPILVLDPCPPTQEGKCSPQGNAFLFLTVRSPPMLKELLLLAFSLFAATMKFLFAIMFAVILMYPNALQPLVSSNFNGTGYITHASLYLVIAIFAAVNTACLLCNRMDSSFFDRPEVLRYYIALNAFGICFQIVIYLLFEYDRYTDMTSQFIGDIMGVLLLVDLLHWITFAIFERFIQNKVYGFSFQTESPIC